MNSSTTTDVDSIHGDKTQHEEKDPTAEHEKHADELDTVEQDTVRLDTENDIKTLSGYQLHIIVFALSLCGFLYSLDVTIIVTAIPVITTHFHTIKDIGWYGSAYLITLCSCVPLIGKLFQHYNQKITFFIFVAIFEIGSLVCATAPSSTAFIIGRAVAGIGGSGLFNGGLTIIAAVSPEEKRPQTLAMVFVFSMVGTVLGPIFGGLLTEKASWRWCFYINLPPGVVALAVLTFVPIPDNRSKTLNPPTLFEIINRLDPIGFVLFAPACIMVLLALQWGGSLYAWNSSTIIGLFVGFVATLAAFLLWEKRRGDTAMVPLSILSQRVVYSSCLAMIMQFGNVQVFAYYLPVWFQTIQGFTPIQSGAYFMATAGPLILATISSGFLVSKIGNPAIFALLGNILAAIGGGLLSTLTPSSHAGTWAGYQVLAGLGRGMVLQQPVNAIQQTLPPAKIPVGTSIVVFCQFFGGALFLALAQTDFSSSLGVSLREYAPGVNETLINSVGATGVRGAVTAEQLSGVLKAYNQAVRNAFYLGAAASAFAFCAAWGMGVKSFRKNKPAGPGDA